MKPSSFVISLAVLGAVFAGVVTSPPARAEEKTAWTERMRELNRVLSELLPDVASTARFNAPQNAKRIEQHTKKLADLTHGLKTATMGTHQVPDADPTLPLIADLFQAETRQAYEDLKRGRRAYARSVLRNIPGYCIGCHTRSGHGPDLSGILKPAFLKNLNRIETAQYLAATRQFDPALEEYRAILDDPSAASGHQLEWEQAARDSLAIAVRVKKDPDRALELVGRIAASPACPQFMKEDALKWLESLKQWKDEPARTAMTEDGLYAEAKRLISMAHELQKYPADRSADMLYLRATATLHDLLRVAPQGPRLPEALFLLGVAYEALRDLNLWSLHELYYEACIRRSPHTEVAQACYSRFEQDIFTGFTGTAGTSLPSDVQVKLTELKNLALPGTAPQR